MRLSNPIKYFNSSNIFAYTRLQKDFRIIYLKVHIGTRAWLMMLGFL